MSVPSCTNNKSQLPRQGTTIEHSPGLDLLAARALPGHSLSGYFGFSFKNRSMAWKINVAMKTIMAADETNVRKVNVRNPGDLAYRHTGEGDGCLFVRW